MEVFGGQIGSELTAELLTKDHIQWSELHSRKHESLTFFVKLLVFKIITFEFF